MTWGADAVATLIMVSYGVPWDGGTTNRAGPRDGPRQVPDMSAMIRRVDGVTLVAPYELCRVADLADAPV